VAYYLCSHEDFRCRIKRGNDGELMSKNSISQILLKRRLLMSLTHPNPTTLSLVGVQSFIAMPHPPWKLI